MKKLIDGMYLNFSLDTAPIAAEELALINAIKECCKDEYIELEHINYQRHCDDIESAYKQGAMDALELVRELFIK